MKNTAIEWADHTFNPWEGCTKVSPGCAHCYAEARNARFGGGTAPNWGIGAPRRRTSVQNWNQVRRWDREAGLNMSCELCRNTRKAPQPGAYKMKDGACWYCYGWEKKRPRVFCASLADWLDDEVPIEWTADLLDLVRVCKNLDFLLLTKRPQNWKERLDHAWNWSIDHDEGAVDFRLWLRAWLDGNPPANVWIGTTVEDQQRADERVPQLVSIPARARFLSCEPLLGQIDLGLFGILPRDVKPGYTPGYECIDWVICGGESGRGARPMHPDWARSLRDQCAAAGVAFHFKQWGEWAPLIATGKDTLTLTYEGKRHAAPREPAWHRWPDGSFSARIGKKFAGRTLDGVEHNEVPAV